MDIRTERQKAIQEKQIAICELWDKTKEHLEYPVPACTIFRLISDKTGSSIAEIRRILIKYGRYGNHINKQAVG